MKNNEFNLGSKDATMIFRFLITIQCNYSCNYCNNSLTTNKRKVKYYTGLRNVNKLFSRHNYGHAFENYKPEKWIKAFGEVKNNFIVEISGGEPFLDIKNFPIFLNGLSKLEKCQHIRIDTNGFWDPKNYDFNEEVLKKTVLNVSYHPTQVDWGLYKKRIDKIFNSGWQIKMINFVMEEKQKKFFQQAYEHFDSKYKIYVNPHPNKFEDVEKSSKELKQYFPELDMKYKVRRESPLGKKCFFPSVSFYLQPTGDIVQACTNKAKSNFFKKASFLKVQKNMTVCPSKKCPCLDMYAFLENSGRGEKLDLLGEYVSNCKNNQMKKSL